jgi:hypothetical protein
MAQAGILGRLQYQEAEHGWALDLGTQLCRFELISGSLTDAEVPGLAATRLEVVQDVNRTLSRQNIRYSVPAIIPDGNQIKEIVEDLLAVMQYRCRMAHIACFFIGMANYYLSIALATKGSAELRGLALNRFKALDIYCGDLGINGPALFERVSRTPCDGQSIRQVLRGLGKPMVILSISADPRNIPRLRLGEEHRVLDEALQSSRIRDAYKLEVLSSCRPQDIGPALRRYSPTILHFSGHGSKKGICVEDQNGDESTIDLEQLARVLSLAKSLGLKGVILNACYSETQAEAIAHAVGYVVAMEGPVSDSGAIEFTRAFYGCLGDGLAFDHAYEWALAQAGLNNAIGRLKPHLITA